LFSYDQALSSDSYDDLQRAMHNLHSTTEQFGVEMFPIKSIIIVFKGQITNRKEL
jgi:hypothetical protein